MGFGKRYVAAIAWSLCALWSVDGSAWIKEAPADQETILEVKLREGLLLSPGLVTYKNGEDPLFPLVEWAEALGFKFSVQKKESGDLVIEGFYIRETYAFYLDTEKCVIRSAHHRAPIEPTPCDSGLLLGEEVYLPKSALEKWFPVRMEVNPYQSVTWIDALEKLPAQLREERARASVFNPADALSVTSEEAVPEHRAWSGPAADIGLEWQMSKTPANSIQEFNSKVFQSSQILGWDQSLSTLFRNGEAGSTRYRLAKKSLHPDLAGPARATQIYFLHHDSPSVPLLSPGGETLGAAISSYSTTTSSNYSTRDFTGPLPEGWEVELYQNEILIQRMASNSEQRYAFKDIPIYYGDNEFKLVFYGPFGEQREERSNYSIGQDQVKPGQLAYQLSAGKVLLRDELNAFGFYGDTVYGFSPTFSGRVGLQTTPLRDAGYSRHYALIEGVGKFPNFLASTHFSEMPASGGMPSGRAMDLDIKLPISRLNIGAKATKMRQFESNLFLKKNDSFQKDQMEAELSLPLPLVPGVATAVLYRKKRFDLSYLDTQLVRNRLSTTVASLYVGHDAQLNWENEEARYEGELTLQHFNQGRSIRTSGTYDRMGLQKADLEFGIPFSDTLYLNPLVAYQVLDRSVTLSGSVAKKFKFGSLNSFVSWNSQKTLEVGAGWQTSLLWDREKKSVIMDADSQATTGHLRLIAYFDENRNQTLDPEEARLANIKFILNKSEVETLTDADGALFIREVPPYQWNTVGIKPDSLPDPAYRPRSEELKVYVRPGAITELTYPIFATGTIDGQVRFWNKGQLIPNKRLTIEAIPLGIDANTAKSLQKSMRVDREGLYWFENLAPGSYLLRIDPDQESNRIYKIQEIRPKERLVEIPKFGGFVSGMDFDVKSYAK